MIYQIDNNDKNLQLNIAPNINSQAYLRINGLYKAYGTGYNFINFYTNDSENLFICVKNNFADIYIDTQLSGDDLIELKEFILIKAEEIITELPIEIIYKTKETGNIYSFTNPIFDRVSFVEENILNISYEPSDCYEVVKDVFSEVVHDGTYLVWYTDLSYRVRHNMSKLFTVKGIATVTAYAYENGVVLISYLGTIEKFQNKGYAKFLLNYVVKELNANKLILASQDENSDNYYKNLGFVKTGEYYNYKL